MRLFEHPDFAAIVTATAEHQGLDERFVEKDYYVTEILRIVAASLPGKVIFKGGTSLSKGWKLIDRFSEDIDLFVDPNRFEPPLGSNGVNRELKTLRDAVATHPALTYLDEESQTIGGRSRMDSFEYVSRFDMLQGIRPVVRLEPGIQSGDYPTADIEISSLAAEFLGAAGQGELAADLDRFQMTLLHFRRTYVEKLFTIHSKVERLKEAGRPLGRHARHYADLHFLGDTEDVRNMLRSDEYARIRDDYDAISRAFYPGSYRPPRDLTFRESEALFPSKNLRQTIEPEYQRECQLLFPGAYPAFEDVLWRFAEFRDML